MPSSRPDITLLTSRALDGELSSADAVQLAALRAASVRSDDAARQIEAAHSHLAVLRDAAVRVASAPVEWAEQIYGALRQQLS